MIRSFLTYDLEWVPGSMELRMCGVYDGEHYRCYTDIESFLQNELTFSNRGKWFYAHAGGLADIQFVFDTIINLNKENPIYNITASFSGSSAIIVHIRRGKNSFHFIDSFWLLRTKLSNIGKWVGMIKGGVQEDENVDDDEFERIKKEKRRWYAEVPFHELRTYNEQDCKILWNAIDSYQQILLGFGGQLQMTQASSAMGLFRRKYLSKDVKTSHYANAMARESYFASRVEVMQKNVTNSFYYDINSSFPYAMTFPCPGDYLGTSDRIPDNGIYIADVEVEVAEDSLTPAPFRMKGRVFFPFGKWRSWFTSIDLELIQNCGGRILKVYSVLRFSEFHDLAQYSNDIYTRRKNSTSDFEKETFKLLLNSLYGKFAENPIKSGLEINPEKTDHETMTMLMPGVWLTERVISIPHLAVPISSHITSIARRTIFNFMKSCKDFHYCDTDGFSTTSVLPTGKGLGELKLEKMIRNGFFVAPKVYRIEGQIAEGDKWKEIVYVKAKGFSRMTSKRFFELVEGKSIDYERMSRVKERFRAKETNPIESTYTKRVIIKSSTDKDFNPKKHSLSKRFFYPDGTSRPWSVDEILKILG